jgi:hypothetical protein
VADALFYYGDGGYRFAWAKNTDRTAGRGHDYDVANTEALLRRVSVRDGRLVVPDGPSYALLVLPDEDSVLPAVLARIEELVKAGATVLGPGPRRAVGLAGGDAEVVERAARLWGAGERGERRVGAGRVLWGYSAEEALNRLGVAPDVDAPAGFDWIHRETAEGDVYFVRNMRDTPLAGRVRFRVAGRRPELWDPVTAARVEAPDYRVNGSNVEVTLDLPRYGATFVVFRQPAAPGASKTSAGVARTALPVNFDGPWRVDFQAGRGAPASAVLPKLASWTENAEPGIRYFSGTARYRYEFDLPAVEGRVELDLGDLWLLADVQLNGRKLGTLWTPPYRVECTSALRAGRNELVVEVTNTWYNRLTGDARLPAAKRLTRTNVDRSSFKPWTELEPLPSGLFGPVRLEAVP